MGVRSQTGAGAIIVASVVLVTSAKISTRGVAEDLPAVEAQS